MADFKCPSCGSLVSEDERYCSSCGENNPKFLEVIQSKNESSSYTSSNNSSSYSNSTNQGSGIGWFLLGLYFPIGFILFFSLKRENPTASSMSFGGAVIGFCIFIISIS
jgi:hypothetical protein